MEKCTSCKSVRLIEIFYERHIYILPGHVKVSVLESCPSYGMSVLGGFTVIHSTAGENFLFW